ncbi:MAG: hypothetical protein A3B99_05435 [Candidatus Yanofskybacteria bacterium RIFCSPHIGHO2_02_FULL_44_12b]|uniref:EfeO-type cupredoxin-like domain-containing protein n=2 Tax=Candidatus Yanofskyibacteriota TaxID=1752733 RepID=A0A1F8GJA8_9BACT|nr:MAG: hypothetical protein A2659_02330 [Candidatus Yanofskybacteria bacterium RIFCSPHIGHO2_01_FULL_44_24]OGN14584.1 MAG: hypothetical protein A3B99_05435 [Candidatus Yanofskybacteria bacterium RIFCSPHIGHO2_02_FULL_44_12b]OGN25474.1 MAG: hypothetical protein A2925_01950 [Candidatus Yanofskybacteria bacterium RIFCSPLOWO2_01_FULL_44_22]
MEPEAQLIVKRRRIIQPINGPGLFWMLIVLSLFSLALSIRILEKGNAGIAATATPKAEIIEPIETRLPRIYTVSYKGGVFSPTNLRIHAGDTVRFKNEGFFPIRIVSDKDMNYLPGFDSIGDIPQGSYFSFTFAAKGIFGYYNDNGPKEKGTIIVR